MKTRETIQRYFDRLRDKNGWEDSLAGDVEFTSFTTPIKHVKGRDAYVQSTRGFYSMIGAFTVRELLTDGDRAVALTRYELRSPAGAFQCDVAEVFSVKDDKIASFDIYFDSAPFSRKT